MKDRASLIFIEKGRIDVLDGAFVVVDDGGVRTHIPLGGFACLMLEPGTRISHAAVALAARAGTLLVWIGEAGVRLYASGQPGGARADRLLWQARLALDETARLKIVRHMFELRFQEPAPDRRSVDQLRGLEGVRVRRLYDLLAQKYGVPWSRRSYDRMDWEAGDPVNRCLSAANACLYGLTEAAVLAAGYAPAIGFLHIGKPLSFVYDIADLVKFETVVPAAFQTAAKLLAGRGEPGASLESQVRRACRDLFRRTRLLERLIPLIETVLTAGEIAPPTPPEAAQPAAFDDPPASGDLGHRG